MKQCSKFLLSLVSCLLLVLLSVSETQAKKAPQTICSFDSTSYYALSFDTRKDTISVVGKGKKKGGFTYYKTSKKNTTVVIRNENKSGVWLGFLSKLITTIFHAKV